MSDNTATVLILAIGVFGLLGFIGLMIWLILGLSGKLPSSPTTTEFETPTWTYTTTIKVDEMPVDDVSKIADAVDKALRERNRKRNLEPQKPAEDQIV